jgi:hypothetical protein
MLLTPPSPPPGIRQVTGPIHLLSEGPSASATDSMYIDQASAEILACNSGCYLVGKEVDCTYRDIKTYREDTAMEIVIEVIIYVLEILRFRF